MTNRHFFIIIIGLCLLTTLETVYGGSAPRRGNRKKTATGFVTLHSLGEFPFLDGTVRTDSASGSALTTGWQSPNVWKEGFPPDTMVTDRTYLELTTPFGEESFYAPIIFDRPVVYEEGWYTYRVLEPYNNAAHIDSLYVRFERDSAEDGNGPLIGGELEPARIVNLVAIDAAGYTRFKILNIEIFERAEVQLFDRAGKLIYRSEDYKNDFDFADRPADTYYYKVTLCSGALRALQKGFVEVIRKK